MSIEQVCIITVTIVLIAFLIKAFSVMVKFEKENTVGNSENNGVILAKKILQHGTCKGAIDCKDCQFGRSVNVTCHHIIRGTPEGIKIVKDYLDNYIL
jgi:hypothetical protein